MRSGGGYFSFSFLTMEKQPLYLNGEGGGYFSFSFLTMEK